MKKEIKKQYDHELWELRLRKILQLEEESHLFYRKLLQEYGPILKNTKAGVLLEKLIREEFNHIRIAHKIFAVARRNRKFLQRETCHESSS